MKTAYAYTLCLAVLIGAANVLSAAYGHGDDPLTWPNIEIQVSDQPEAEHAAADYRGNHDELNWPNIERQPVHAPETLVERYEEMYASRGSKQFPDLEWSYNHSELHWPDTTWFE